MFASNIKLPFEMKSFLIRKEQLLYLSCNINKIIYAFL